MRKRRTRLAAAAAVAAIAFAGVACEPTDDPAWTWQIAGDSITFQAGYYGGDLHGAQTAGLVGLGWQAANAQDQLTANVNNPEHSPRTFAMAFGWNYADVYGQAEANELYAMAFTPDPAACVVIVLPGGRPDPNITRVRSDLTALHEARLGNGLRSVLVDWQPILDVHPEYLDVDGVHLAPSPAVPWDSAIAFADMLEAGRQECLAAP